MYNLKVVNGAEFSLTPCKHMNITRLDGSESQTDNGLPGEPGYLIRLSPGGEVFQLPKDGQVAYILNELGDTIQSVKWPDGKGGK